MGSLADRVALTKEVKLVWENRADPNLMNPDIEAAHHCHSVRSEGDRYARL